MFRGDNLQFLKTCYGNADPLIKGRVKGKVKLIYIDPPFATKSDFRGSGDEKSYSDKVDSAEFIEGLRERLIYMRELLSIDRLKERGKNPDDVWSTIFPVQGNSIENTNYPTQKPEALLERIILASSNPGDLVMDIFAGSGTTAAVAEKLGRRWIVCDFGKHAIYTMQKRMLRIGESKALGSAEGGIKKNQKYGKPPKPFCVVSTGAYDFSRIMKLRENKDAYIDFVLGLFQSSRDEKDLSGKYRLSNIFGEKDGDPVEVYPVWNDEYLKNIRIDEKYLKGIILQSRGKLKGNYYIITPETCTLIGDTTMKNSAGNEVHFKMLKFP